MDFHSNQLYCPSVFRFASYPDGLVAVLTDSAFYTHLTNELAPVSLVVADTAELLTSTLQPDNLSSAADRACTAVEKKVGLLIRTADQFLW